MKKFFIVFALLMSTVIGMSAQIATQNSKFFDNWYVGVNGGAFTNIDFNSTFPLNATAGLKVGRNITPILGVNVEGTVFFGDNFTHKLTSISSLSRYGESKSIVKATYVGANITLNWSNLLFGYHGSPRFFEVGTETGFGWIHGYNFESSDFNDFGGKAGVYFAINPGSAKAWQIYAEPVVYWDFGATMGVNKHDTELGLQVGIIYKFKNSNGTHNFVTWNVGEMNNEINKLRAENQKLRNKPAKIKVVEKTVEKTVEKEVTGPVKYVVTFEKGSSVLGYAQKRILDQINSTATVEIEGQASPDGPEVFNKVLSQNRAKRVAEYLTKRGLIVASQIGTGESAKNANRVAIITVK